MDGQKTLRLNLKYPKLIVKCNPFLHISVVLVILVLQRKLI